MYTENNSEKKKETKRQKKKDISHFAFHMFAYWGYLCNKHFKSRGGKMQ